MAVRRRHLERGIGARPWTGASGGQWFILSTLQGHPRPELGCHPYQATLNGAAERSVGEVAAAWQARGALRFARRANGRAASRHRPESATMWSSCPTRPLTGRGTMLSAHPR